MSEDRYAYWLSESRNGAVEFRAFSGGWSDTWFGRCVTCGEDRACEFWWPPEAGTHWSPLKAEPLRFAWIGTGPHCFACHQNGHLCCRVCGRCIRRTKGAYDFQHARDRVEGARIDRVYCSPACRQRAYRRRQATTPPTEPREDHP
ncbi:MAG: hypothetical protein J2P58_01800 [Acidimicrobiaceae bacterium]|nr:hypothetical protein [Acidimicrobiaceae bacterium]